MVEQKSIADFTITELKALAYDELSKIELGKYNLKVINDEINKRINEAPVSEVSPSKNDK